MFVSLVSLAMAVELRQLTLPVPEPAGGVRGMDPVPERAGDSVSLGPEGRRALPGSLGVLCECKVHSLLFICGSHSNELGTRERALAHIISDH